MRNFKMTTDIFPKTTADKVASNIAAIKLVKKLEDEELQATTAEQEILAKYVGWGGLANDFFSEDNSRFENERLELKSLVSEHEYTLMQDSSLTAYYTDPMIARAMWEHLENDGFEGGNILDPSMGTGIFFATMPENIMSNSSLYGVELDKVTGLIAKQLFPDATISITGFEKLNFEEGSFDLVMSNIPFSSYQIIDKKYDKPYLIHDYFIKKSVELVDEKGIVAVITSTGSVDKRTNSILQEIKDKVAFLGGVRLPNSAFKTIAGTSVTTDILYFQKDKELTVRSNTMLFDKPVKTMLDKEMKSFMNPYFFHNTNQVLGEFKVNYFNGVTISVKQYEHTNLKIELKDALDNLIKTNYRQTEKPVVLTLAGTEDLYPHINLHEFAYLNGQIVFKDHEKIKTSTKPAEMIFYQDVQSQFVKWDEKYSDSVIEEFETSFKENPEMVTSTYISPSASARGKNKGLYKGTYFYEKPLEEIEIKRVLGMIEIKNAYQAIIDIQLTDDYSDEDFENLLIDLNNCYDNFVKKFGFINQPVNARLFERDDKYPLIASLEAEEVDKSNSKKVVYSKTDAFKKSLIRPKTAIKLVDNADDALSVSLSEGRGIDFDFMTKIFPSSSTKSILLDLGDRVIINIEQYYKNSIVAYRLLNSELSGDVVTKKEYAKKLIEKGDTTYDWKKYLDLITAVIPEKIILDDINFQIGSPWIPDNIIGLFAYRVVGDFTDCKLEDTDFVNHVVSTSKVGRSILDSFKKHIYYRDSNIQLGLKSNSTNKYSRAIDIIDYLLGSDQPTITKNIGTEREPKRVTDQVATENLRAAEKKIQDLFSNFVKEDEKLSQIVEDTYNSIFNRRVNKIYDGQYLEIDGLAKNITLLPHQKDIVQRAIEERRILLSWVVGSGKTLGMLAAAFKLKELGIINRPLFTVPSSLTAQFGQEILKFFPTKKVLVTTERDFEKSRRKLFISRIITGDYDAIVIGHSQFEKIKVSEERQRIYYADKIYEMDSVLEVAKNANDKISFKQATAIKKRLETQLSKIEDCIADRKDTFITFESLGIDMLFVDEAHKFKNIRPTTRLGNVVGIGQTTAQKNMDLEMKIRSIQEEHDGKNIVLATGTPISNSISELYTMMNYIQPDVLADFGIDNFDSWVGSFGIIENSLELNPTGDKYISRKRFSKFTNLPELMSIFKITSDVKMEEDLDLPVPEVEKIAIKSELTDAQKSYLEVLVQRSEDIKSGSVDPSEDNMLKITSEARKLAIDMRLLDNSCYSLTDTNKLLQVVDRVEKIYHKTTNNLGTQMIFSDLGTPSAGRFTIYQELKDLLIERGIPEKEIAFIHDATNSKSKIQLQRMMNAGEIRILFASTEKGGTGLNVQRRMKAVHHLDVPWKPSDIIQRNGRLIRQGNLYKTVNVYFYITKGSFDNYLWQIQEQKLKFITQALTSRTPVRAADDIDEQTMTAADFKAIATGNPYLKLKMELDNEFELLTSRRKAWKYDLKYNQARIKQSEELIKTLEGRLTRIDEDIILAESTKPYTVEVDGEEVEQNSFEMTFADNYVTNKKDIAGNQLHYLMQTNVSPLVNKPVVLATYRGFKLCMNPQKEEYRNGRILALNIVGSNSYNISVDFASPIGTIQKINNVLKNLESAKKKTLNEITVNKAIVTRGQGDIVFSDQERLDYISAKRNTINPLIEESNDEETIKLAIEEFENNFEGVKPEETIDSVSSYSEVESDIDDNQDDFIKEINEEVASFEPDPFLEELLKEFLEDTEELLNLLESSETEEDTIAEKSNIVNFNSYTNSKDSESIVKEVSLFDFL